MKRGKSFWFNASILVLVWTIYYYAKRSTGGVVNTVDNIVCGIISLICIFIIAKKLISYIRSKK